jgi:type I protein arginine methyltransferase
VKPVIPPLPFVESYRDASTHQMMLEDVVRTTSYDDALRETVKPDSRVIDFGAGTGVLSIFAARHGAAQVDAIERSTFVRHARRIARDTGYPDIRFHHADHETFSTDGPADILVSEWMGHFLFYEAMMEPLIAVRDRWLKEEGIMIPARVSMHAALLLDETFHAERAFFLGNPYGIDFSSIASDPLRQNRRVRVEPPQISERLFHLGELDMKTVKETPRSLVGKMKPYRATLAYGIVAWFDCELTDNVRFGTGPHDAGTHWEHLYFPFPEPFVVVPERELTLEICPPRQTEDEEPTWAWSMTDGDETVVVDERDTFDDAARDPDED